MKIKFICERDKPGEVSMYTLEQGARRSAIRSREADGMSWRVETLDTIIKFHSTANEFSSCCDHRPLDTRVSNIIVDRGRRGHLCFVFT